LIQKPHSAASERNREPILTWLRQWFADRRHVLEIGSGTGQHAVHFAEAMPHLIWQSSDRAENLTGIHQWLDEAGLPNAPAPLELDVMGEWPRWKYDAIFSANTLHIMAWHEVESLFASLPLTTTDDACVAIYGPFNIDGQFTSESNAAFDHQLKMRATHMGIRDISEVDGLAASVGFDLAEDIAMPANNRLRLWRRRVVPSS
jgi:cyclopropane fatty-acyl-phospholipid synthase-like methyltransferase